MAKPTQLPTWATDLVNNADPGTVKQALGWVFREKPASTHFNWWQNLVGQWIEYIQNGVVSYPTIQELEANVDVGDVGYVQAPAVDPWEVLYTKSESDLGGAGHTAEQCIAVGSDTVVATAFVGTDTFLRSFQINGAERWNRNTGAADVTVDLSFDGSYIAWVLRDNGTGTERIEIIDPTDGSLLHTIAEDNASAAQGDGAILYVCRDNNQVLAFSNYWDSGSIATDWSTAITIGVAENIAVDGERVFVTGQLTTNNIVVLDVAGNVIGGDNVNGENSAAGTIDQIVVDESGQLWMVSQANLLRMPGYLTDEVGGAWPPTNWNVFSSLLPELNSHTAGPYSIVERFDFGWGYLVFSTSLSNQVIAMPRPTGNVAPPVFFEQWDTDINDCCLSPIAVSYCGNENGDGNALIVRALPSQGRWFRVVDPATDPRRAPTWSTIQEVR